MSFTAIATCSILRILSIVSNLTHSRSPCTSRRPEVRRRARPRRRREGPLAVRMRPQRGHQTIEDTHDGLSGPPRSGCGRIVVAGARVLIVPTRKASPQRARATRSSRSAAGAPAARAPRRVRSSAEHRARLQSALDGVRATCDVAARLAVDPVGVVHRYGRLVDRELVGLIASSVAFGNVKALRAKLEDALARLGPDVAAVADDELDVFARLHGWKHRVYRGEDLARLIIGARRVQRVSGSLGLRFAEELARGGDAQIGRRGAARRPHLVHPGHPRCGWARSKEPGREARGGAHPR